MSRKKKLIGFMSAFVIFAVLIGFNTGCNKAQTNQPKDQTAVQGAKQEIDMELQKQADAFLQKYLAEYQAKYTAAYTASWKASNSGKKEDYDATAKASLELNQLHSDPQRFAEIEKFLAKKDKLDPITARSLQVAWYSFKGNQLPKELLEKMATMQADIEQNFVSFRAKIDGKTFSDNELLEKMKTAVKTPERKKIWEAEKQIGAVVADKLIALAKVRNEAAQKLGFKNYWDMQIRLQEHDPENIMTIFNDLENKTNESFKQMKAKMDGELAARFKIKPEEMMPWHYDNPFFQAPPPSPTLDLDEFYKNKKKEDIVEIAKRFYNDIGLPIEGILVTSDLYERPGKNQHAFCGNIDLQGTVSALLNIKPTEEWMDTMLHEMGHGIYSKYTDLSLPCNIRDAAHPFTTEAVAMYFGALAKNANWLVRYAGADPKRAKEVEPAALEQRKREQFLFARWVLVMLNFEKSFYENPDQDLNKLWWDCVERYQFLKRPEKRNAPDWASKIHFVIAPVYYHNYQLGEMFAAQIRNTVVKLTKHQGPAYTMDIGTSKEVGDFFRDKIIKPSNTLPWPEFVKKATGEPLTATYFAEELK